MRLLVLLVALSGCATTQKIVVATDRGPLVGRAGAGLLEFRGIPYLPWPRYSAERDQHLSLDLSVSVGSHLKGDLCDFWDAL
jgi:hypothetical protein